MAALASPIPREHQAELLRAAPKLAGAEPQMVSTRLRSIPDELWKEHEEEIRLFLDEELGLARSERSDFIRNIVRWKKAYKAPKPDEPKHFPIHNASNLTVPVIKEIVNTIAAQLVQSTLTARPRWVIEDMAEEWEPFVDEIEQFLDMAADRDLSLESVAIPWIIEATKLGTSIVEVSYFVDERKNYVYDESGIRIYPRTIVKHDGPKMWHLPLQRFWIRLHEKNIQDARWVAKEFEWDERQLREKESQNRAFNVDKIVPAFEEYETDDVTQADEEMEDKEPADRQKYQIFEFWLSWDLDGDGNYEELKLLYHPESGTFLNRHFNPNWTGDRPFYDLHYQPVEHRFYSEGLCEMLEQLQDGISQKHNQRSDNATMANLKMIVKRKMLKTVMPGDPWYTGKIIEANDIWNDIREFQMAEIYPSTVAEEQILRDYAERLSGHNEALAGSAMPVSRTTLGAQLALLQEQAKRIDMTVRNIRAGLNSVGVRTMNLYFQYGTNGKGIAWLGERGRKVEALFRLPHRIVELGFAMKVQTPTSVQNRQVKRENAVQKFNLIVQLYKEIIPLAQFLAPQQLPEVVHGMVKGAMRFMGDVLESFEDTDPEGVLAGLAVLEKILPASEDLGGLGTFTRRVESAETVDRLERLESLLREAEGASRRDERVRSGSGTPRRFSPPERDGRRAEASLFIGGESLFSGGEGQTGGPPASSR